MLLDTLTQFDRLSRDLLSQPVGAIGAPVDVRRDGDRYLIDADLPGVDPSSLDVTVEGDVLTIRAERSHASTTEDARWVVRERSTSTMVRRFTLGDDVDPDGIEAAYRDGVLSVEVPIAAGARRHKIAVTAGSTGRAALTGSDSEQADAGKAQAAHSHAS